MGSSLAKIVERVAAGVGCGCQAREYLNDE